VAVPPAIARQDSTGPAAAGRPAVAVDPRVVQGPQNFTNAVTADKGLAEIGTRRPTGWNQPGECVMSVSRWLSAAGGRMASGCGPTQNYLRSPALQVPLGEAVKGDVFQYTSNASPDSWPNGVHTGVIVQNYGNGRFWIVQSNAPGSVNGVWRSDASGLVTENRNWAPAPPAGFSVHLWRFGQVGDPFGSLDSAAGALGGFIGVNGWSIDPDAPTTSGSVHVYIDGPAGSGARGVAVPANVVRPDVAAAYPGAGSAHGFSTAISGIPVGTHRIWVYLINVAGGGSNPLLGTPTVTVPAVPGGSPFGAFDAASGRVGGAARVTGWTIDPDAVTRSTQVHVYIDAPAGSGARGVNLGLANKSRPDVGASFRGAGNAHGFDSVIGGLSPGVHTLWVYAINAAGGGANPLLRTLQATVSP